MPIEKPKKPTELVPRVFGGIKNNFSEELQSTGFEPNIPQTYNGDNLNYHLDATGKELDYVEKVVDFINGIPSGSSLYVNKDNQLDYREVDELGDSRYIGQTIFSLDPLIEDELHLLDGALLSVGGIYDQFINGYIANLYANYPKRFCTESEWQSSVKTYGVCGKYVYNAGVSVRLPKVGNYLNSTSTSSTAPVIGNGKCLGLNDGTYQYGFYENSNNVISTSLNLYGASVGTAQTTSGVASNLKGIGVTTNPTYSGLVANLSNITQPLEGYYYIVVATGSKTDIEVDIDNIATDLNSKADVSLSNTTPSKSFKANSASWCLPDFSKRIFCATLPYTAPANGWIIGVANISGSSDLYLYIDGVDIAKENDDYCDVCVPVSKGQALTASDTIEASRNWLYFYPMKGNG